MSKSIELNKAEIIRRIKLNNPGKFDYSPLEDWEYIIPDRNQKITLICKCHNEPFEISLKNALRNPFKCPKCLREEYFEKSYEESILLIEKYFPNKYEIITKNVENKTITIRCKDCGEIISLMPRDIRASVLKTSLCKGCRIPWTKEGILKRWYLKWEDRYEILKLEFTGKTWMTATITVKCNLCGKIYEGKVKNFIHCYPPCSCNRSEDINSENFIKHSKEIWGENTFEYISIDVHNIQDKVTLRCLKHDEIFQQRVVGNLKHQNGCPECKREITILNGRLSNEEFIRRCKIIYGDQLSYEKTQYIDYLTPVIVTCKDHGDVEQKAEYLLKHVGCPICIQDKSFVSKGEKFIIKTLRENDIDYKFHKEFPDCVYKGMLEFDFYLPAYNACIEYQGEQHYKIVRFHKCTLEQARENFKELQIKDNIKRRYCKEKGIELIEIPHWLTYYKVEEWLKEYFENRINLFEEECLKKRPLL